MSDTDARFFLTSFAEDERFWELKPDRRGATLIVGRHQGQVMEMVRTTRESAFPKIKATQHQMAQSLYGKRPNMEDVARKAGLPPKTLWRLYRLKNATAPLWASKLEQHYYKVFPDPHFSVFFQKRDEALQNAFQMAVADRNVRDRGPLKAIFESDWTWLSCWSYADDKAAEHYLRARYALISGWANVPLSDDQTDPLQALELAIREIDACEAELDRNLQRPHLVHLRMKLLKLRLAAGQRYHHLTTGRHISTVDVVGHSRAEEWLKYVLEQVTGWPVGHFNRWQLARDAVSTASALGTSTPVSRKDKRLEECSIAYEILLEEQPRFADPDHQEWSVTSAAEDPDLGFFRANFDAINELIRSRSDKCAV